MPSKKKNSSSGRSISEAAFEKWLTCFSHEFRTPLNAVITFADLLSSEVEGCGDDAREMVGNISEGGLRLLALIEKLEALIDLERGKSLFLIEPTSVKETVNKALLRFGPEVRKRVSVTIPPKLSVKADDVKLEILVRELLGNAFLHGDGRLVTCKAKRQGNKAVLEVVNQLPAGINVDPKRVFKKFYQANRGDLTSKPPGMGVGLTVSKLLARGMQGSLSCDLKKNNRWLMRLTLPLAGKS